MAERARRDEVLRPEIRRVARFDFEGLKRCENCLLVGSHVNIRVRGDVAEWSKAHPC